MWNGYSLGLALCSTTVHESTFHHAYLTNPALFIHEQCKVATVNITSIHANQDTHSCVCVWSLKSMAFDCCNMVSFHLLRSSQMLTLYYKWEEPYTMWCHVFIHDIYVPDLFSPRRCRCSIDIALVCPCTGKSRWWWCLTASMGKVPLGPNNPSVYYKNLLIQD